MEARTLAVGDRIKAMRHEGIPILAVDVSHCSAREVEQILRELPNTVTAHPPGSVLLLADFTAAMLDDDALVALKEAAVFDKPYIRKSAWVGADHILEIRDLVSHYARRDFPTFKTRYDAMQWLVQD